jgi:hypothetical protein
VEESVEVLPVLSPRPPVLSLMKRVKREGTVRGGFPNDHDSHVQMISSWRSQASENRRSWTKLKFHLLGIPTFSPRSGETYLEKYGLYCTDHESNPFGSQWMRYDKDCPLPEIVQTVPHVAFEVDDLEEALLGHEILQEGFIECSMRPSGNR